jgi:hypothetical protein
LLSLLPFFNVTKNTLNDKHIKMVKIKARS